jgi:hypothetical protein
MYIPRLVKLFFTVDDGWISLLDSNGDCGWQHITFTMPHSGRLLRGPPGKRKTSNVKPVF